MASRAFDTYFAIFGRFGFMRFDVIICRPCGAVRTKMPDDTGNCFSICNNHSGVKLLAYTLIIVLLASVARALRHQTAELGPSRHVPLSRLRATLRNFHPA